MVFVVITEATQDFSFLQASGSGEAGSGEKEGWVRGVAGKAWSFGELCLPMP